MTSSAQTRSGPDVQVTPRDMRFDTRTAANGPWLGGDVTATAVFNALSLTFPIGERLFIDAIRDLNYQASKLQNEEKALSLAISVENSSTTLSDDTPSSSVKGR